MAAIGGASSRFFFIRINNSYGLAHRESIAGAGVTIICFLLVFFGGAVFFSNQLVATPIRARCTCRKVYNSYQSRPKPKAGFFLMCVFSDVFFYNPYSS